MLVIIIYQSGKNLIKSVVNYAVMIFPSTLRGTGDYAPCTEDVLSGAHIRILTIH